MKLGKVKTAGKMAALMLAALTCCLACDSGNAGSTVRGGQSPSSLPAPTPASASSQVPVASASTGQAAGAAPKSQYLSNLDSVASSGSFLAGNVEVNGRYYPHCVTQLLDPGPASVSYNLGRQWRTLDMTLWLSDAPSEADTVQFKVTADNRILYTGNFTIGQSRHVRLNVAGVARLDLTTTLVSSYTGSVSPEWGSAELLS